MCISCKTLAGEIVPPGGFLFENSCWVVFLRSKPPLVAGQGFIVLKRHCENMSELTHFEQQTLGTTMARTAFVMSEILHAQKVHFGLYAEQVKHIHLHLTPRTADLPAGNIPLLLLSLWRETLQKLHLRKPITDDLLRAQAEELRTAFDLIVRPSKSPTK